MLSLSHWGMFEVAAPRLVVSEEMFSEIEKAEWIRPGNIIWIDRNDAVQYWPAPTTYRAPDWDPA